MPNVEGSNPFARFVGDQSESNGCGGLVNLVCFAAWITHAIACLKSGSCCFLIAGLVIYPIGIVHGIGIWFGWWE